MSTPNTLYPYIECNGADRGPPRPTAWPPAWLAKRTATHEVPAEKPDQSGQVVTEKSDQIGQAFCRCGSSEHRDFRIHSGQSVRRDCAACKRFLSFPVWYGKELHS